MAKDDFDINFDFDQEYDFDPNAFLDGGEYDENMDYSEFSDQDLGLSDADISQPDAMQADTLEGDFDLDMDLDSFLNIGGQEDIPYQEEDFNVDVPEFAQRDASSHFNVSGYGAPPEIPRDYVPSQLEEEPPQQEPQAYYEDTPGEQSAEQPEKPRRQRKERAPKPPREAKPMAPNIFTKFFDLYFGPVLHKEMREEPQQDPNNPRRRRRKSKAQIFKEVYLPPIVVCLTLVLVLTFAIGSLSNFIAEQRLKKQTEESRLESSESAAEQAESAAKNAIDEATRLATSYDYAGAITALDNFLATVEDTGAYPDVTGLRSQYVQDQSQLVVYKDPSLIPNLSFHVLINDMSRAKQNTELSGQYNRNFVTTDEFTRILGEIYNNGYVLVDFDSFTTNSDGTILTKDIALPEGKKPIMLTETMVNYFTYMINDYNGTDVSQTVTPDANGDGFASRLVVDANGDIKAEYVDSSGNTLVGDYDFVPILETFIKEHPDFSYQGARAILAVTGSQGIFGYRINTSYQADIGEAYRNEQVAGATTLVQALRNKGYTLACYTYSNKDYRDMNANQIQDDLTQWTQQITPILGQVDIMVYAREADISSYSGNAFNVMSTTGFRYFVTNGASPSTEINTTYVRQKRLMVTGNTLAWKQDMFSGIFDPNSVIDLSIRGDVPN